VYTDISFDISVNQYSGKKSISNYSTTGTDTGTIDYLKDKIYSHLTMSCPAERDVDWNYTNAMDPCTFIPGYGGKETYTRSDDSMTHYYFMWGDVPGHFVEWQVEITLGGALSNSGLMSDAVSLLSNFDLTDDVQYPWRGDNYQTVAPILRYDGYGPVEPILEVSEMTSSYLDIGNTSTGDLLGQPLPNGYNGWFDAKHQTWQSCLDDITGWQDYVDKLGAKSGVDLTHEDLSDAGIPKSATNWLDTNEAAGLPPGAFISYDAPSRTLTIMKYAEILVPHNSYNYARPCGADRFAVDNYTCIDTFDGTTNITILDVSAINTGDNILLAGTGTGKDGGWTIVKDDAYHYHLNTRLWTWPTGSNAYRPDLDNGKYFGRLRFNSAPAICGVVPITDIIGLNPVTCSLAESTYLRNGDSVTINDVVGVSNVNGTHTVLVISPTVIVLSGVTGSGSYNQVYRQGWLQTTGTDPYWDDSQAKGEYTFKQWFFDYRNLASNYVSASRRSNQVSWGLPNYISNFTCTTDCLSTYNQCAPAVICVSPNGESFRGGRTYSFPNISFDYQYGSRWQGLIEQMVGDPLWSPPAPPCPTDTSVQWIEDDGTCQTDYEAIVGGVLISYKFYPHRPMVESRCSPPVGAPSLPTGSYYIGCVDYATMSSSVGPGPGNVCLPPNAIGQFHTVINQPETAWSLYLKEFGCVCGAGRFAGDYEKDQVTCIGDLS